MDIFSRKIVGWRIHEVQEADLAGLLLEDICKTEKISPFQIVLHSDNGSPMKGSTMRATMDRLKVTLSFSRPSVSDDNPFPEALFKTVKYCPFYPTKPFESLSAAIDWMEKFVDWYNTQHLHSGINFVTPDSKHKGHDIKILKYREKIYKQAQTKNPNRWSGKTRGWGAVEKVKLNPLKEKNKSSTTNQLKQIC
jgi:putative transposase